MTVDERLKPDDLFDMAYNKGIDASIKLVKAALVASGNNDKYGFIITVIVGGLEAIKTNAPKYNPPKQKNQP